jgi:hypothetical protein
MANHSRWEDIKRDRSEPTAKARADIEQDLAFGQLIYDLRTEVPGLLASHGTTLVVVEALVLALAATNRAQAETSPTRLNELRASLVGR